jgi:glycosyltransferase involved in cell wall biosynthesis
MRPMRICFLCNEYPPGPHGGIGTMTQVLARALVGAGHQVRVIGIYPHAYPAPDYEVDQGVRIWRYRESTFRFGWVLDRYRLYRTVARWGRQGKIELVEAPDWEGWLAGWPRLNIPAVARLNGSVVYFAQELNLPLKRTAYMLERSSLRRVDFWCSASQYTADVTQRLFSLPKGADAILYNPVEMPAESCPAIRSSNRVIFTGTLTAKKGVISLIRAWPLVLEAFGDAELHMFGKEGPADGPAADSGLPMTQYLQSQLGSHTVESVHFHGHVARQELFEAFRTARLGVFPSYAEAFGIAPVESMSYGCPTIYTRRPPGPEIIRDEQDGLLIDPERPDDIAQAIIRMLTDDDLAQRLGAAGLKRFHERFSIGALLPQNEAFYRKSIDDFAKAKHS